MISMQSFARWLAVGVTTLGTQLFEFQAVAFFFYLICTTNAPPLCIYCFVFGRLGEKP